MVGGNDFQALLMKLSDFSCRMLLLKKQGGMGELAPDELNDLHDLAAESGCVDLLDLECI